MTVEAFFRSLQQPQPPDGLNTYLLALWLDGRGDWNGAHETIQDLEDPGACLIHGYLHRKEGDRANASYWYRRAGRPMPDQDLQTEWEALVREFAPAS